ncbi:MAG: PilZ domain-containing protein [Desulfomonilaceae bacterium]|nr:PilZ domain-containing protein [Desulfomonilaceae bacterium]
MTISEKRRFTRAPFQTEVRVISDDRIVVSHHLQNVSLGGAYVLVDNPLPQGMPCILNIDLIGPRSLLRVEIEGEVIRVEEKGMAVKFTRIDVDSLVHLRHFIRIHAQDPDAVDYEFESNFLDKEDAP